MTLGCGAYGGNITSDNITPLHLINIKRLAYELRPVNASTSPPECRRSAGADVPLPRAPQRAPAEPVSAESLSRRIDQFLQSRGIGARTAGARGRCHLHVTSRGAAGGGAAPAAGRTVRVRRGRTGCRPGQ